AMDASRPARPRHAGPRPPWLPGALLLLAIAAAAAWWWAGSRPGKAPPPVPAPALQVDLVTSLPGGELFPALSPDASLLAFSADPDGQGARVYLQVPGAERPARRLSDAPADNEFYPVFSPDGRELMLQRVLDGACSIVIASVLGGA